MLGKSRHAGKKKGFNSMKSSMSHIAHYSRTLEDNINPLNAELNPIRHLLALVGARHIVHVSRIGVKMNLQKVGRAWTGLIWPKTGTGGGHL